MDIILNTEKLGINFGGIQALSNFNLCLKSEEIVGIIGPNGAGKTTIFNLITGVYAPSSGSIFYKGKRINGLPPHIIASLGISRTFQSIRLIPYLSVLENVMLGRALRVNESPLDAVILHMRAKSERVKWISHAEEILHFVGLYASSDLMATDLPFGKQRVVEIARAIATGAELILMDEPGAGMSAQEKKELMDLIASLRTSMNKTIILIEHDMKLAFKVVDRIVALDFGCQIAEGSPEIIRNDVKVIEAYLGKEGG